MDNPEVNKYMYTVQNVGQSASPASSVLQEDGDGSLIPPKDAVILDGEGDTEAIKNDLGTDVDMKSNSAPHTGHAQLSDEILPKRESLECEAASLKAVGKDAVRNKSRWMSDEDVRAATFFDFSRASDFEVLAYRMVEALGQLKIPEKRKKFIETQRKRCQTIFESKNNEGKCLSQFVLPETPPELPNDDQLSCAKIAAAAVCTPPLVLQVLIECPIPLAQTSFLQVERNLMLRLSYRISARAVITPYKCGSNDNRISYLSNESFSGVSRTHIDNHQSFDAWIDTSLESNVVRPEFCSCAACVCAYEIIFPSRADVLERLFGVTEYLLVEVVRPPSGFDTCPPVYSKESGAAFSKPVRCERGMANTILAALDLSLKEIQEHHANVAEDVVDKAPDVVQRHKKLGLDGEHENIYSWDLPVFVLASPIHEEYIGCFNRFGPSVVHTCESVARSAEKAFVTPQSMQLQRFQSNYLQTSLLGSLTLSKVLLLLLSCMKEKWPFLKNEYFGKDVSETLRTRIFQKLTMSVQYIHFIEDARFYPACVPLPPHITALDVKSIEGEEEAWTDLGKAVESILSESEELPPWDRERSSTIAGIHFAWVSPPQPLPIFLRNCTAGNTPFVRNLRGRIRIMLRQEITEMLLRLSILLDEADSLTERKIAEVDCLQIGELKDKNILGVRDNHLEQKLIKFWSKDFDFFTTEAAVCCIPLTRRLYELGCMLQLFRCAENVAIDKAGNRGKVLSIPLAFLSHNQLSHIEKLYCTILERYGVDQLSSTEDEIKPNEANADDLAVKTDNTTPNEQVSQHSHLSSENMNENFYIESDEVEDYTLSSVESACIGNALKRLFRPMHRLQHMALYLRHLKRLRLSSMLSRSEQVLEVCRDTTSHERMTNVKRDAEPSRLQRACALIGYDAAFRLIWAGSCSGSAVGELALEVATLIGSQRGTEPQLIKKKLFLLCQFWCSYLETLRSFWERSRLMPRVIADTSAHVLTALWERRTCEMLEEGSSEGHNLYSPLSAGCGSSCVPDGPNGLPDVCAPPMLQKLQQLNCAIQQRRVSLVHDNELQECLDQPFDSLRFSLPTATKLKGICEPMLPIFPPATAETLDLCIERNELMMQQLSKKEASSNTDFSKVGCGNNFAGVCCAALHEANESISECMTESWWKHSFGDFQPRTATGYLMRAKCLLKFRNEVLRIACSDRKEDAGEGSKQVLDETAENVLATLRCDKNLPSSYPHTNPPKTLFNAQLEGELAFMGLEETSPTGLLEQLVRMLLVGIVDRGRLACACTLSYENPNACCMNVPAQAAEHPFCQIRRRQHDQTDGHMKSKTQSFFKSFPCAFEAIDDAAHALQQEALKHILRESSNTKSCLHSNISWLPSTRLLRACMHVEVLEGAAKDLIRLFGCGRGGFQLINRILKLVYHTLQTFGNKDEREANNICGDIVVPILTEETDVVMRTLERRTNARGSTNKTEGILPNQPAATEYIFSMKGVNAENDARKQDTHSSLGIHGERELNRPEQLNNHIYSKWRWYIREQQGQRVIAISCKF